MKGYKPVTSLVNGEIIKDLLDLCNNNFIMTDYQPYAGANSECFYCQSLQKRDGLVNHKENCPVTYYKEIVEKHKRFIVSK